MTAAWFVTRPTLAPAIGVAVVATLALGLYPRPLFDAAAVSARAVGARVTSAALR